MPVRPGAWKHWRIVTDRRVDVRVLTHCQHPQRVATVGVVGQHVEHHRHVLGRIPSSSTTSGGSVDRRRRHVHGRRVQSDRPSPIPCSGSGPSRTSSVPAHNARRPALRSPFRAWLRPPTITDDEGALTVPSESCCSAGRWRWRSARSSRSSMMRGRRADPAPPEVVGDDPGTLSRPVTPVVPGIVNETAGTVARSAAGVTVTTQPFPLSPSRSCESTRSKCAPRTMACPRCVLAGPFPLDGRLLCG